MNKLYISLLTTCLSASPVFADCGKVSISEPNWASGALVTSISKFLMEQGYGCSVTTMPGGSTPTLASIAETGQPDLVAELYPTSAPAFYEMEAEGKIVSLGFVLATGATEGWWVPEYLVDEYPDLAKIEGILANPSLVGGMFHNSPTGWGSRVKSDNLHIAFGFKEAGIKVFDHGSGETLAGSIGSAYENKEPWFGYYWGPTAVMGRYPMVHVDLGPFDQEIYDCVNTKECENPQRTSFGNNSPAIIGAVPDFSSREPEAAALMSNVGFTNPEMQGLLAWQDDNNASTDETMAYFIENHSDKWSTWINQAAKDKLSALIK